MLCFEKDDEYEAEVKLLDLLRNHQKGPNFMEYNIAKELAKYRKEKQNITTFTCFRIAVIFRITYYRRLA